MSKLWLNGGILVATLKGIGGMSKRLGSCVDTDWCQIVLD